VDQTPEQLKELEDQARAQGKKLKVEVQTFSCSSDSWSTNALRFDTAEKAVEHAQDLFSRWTAMKTWRIAIANDE
jgi:hypothetical protein